MNSTKAAAIIALIVSIVATACLCYYLYENVMELKYEGELMDCHDRHIADADCNPDSPSSEYGISGGVAVVALITSLALFGAAKSKQ